MATMTPREQIEVGDLVRWEHPDRTKWAEGRLVRLHAPIAQPCADVDVQSSNFLSAGETATLGLGCEAVFCRIISIRTPVGDIPVRADPALQPDEFRIESGPCGLDADLRERLERASDPTEEHARRVLAKETSRDKSAVFDFNRMLDEHYPRDESGRHYIPAPPKVDWAKLTKTKMPPYKLAPFRFESREQFVGAMKADARASTATVLLPDGRPDGFAQSKIDEIKAMLTAPVKGKR